jgi:hypothetical protein
MQKSYVLSAILMDTTNKEINKKRKETNNGKEN